eukprot:scaffold2026_cov78-Cylindrotheca_fusiformis.AAC.8
MNLLWPRFLIAFLGLLPNDWSSQIFLIARLLGIVLIPTDRVSDLSGACSARNVSIVMSHPPGQLVQPENVADSMLTPDDMNPTVTGEDDQKRDQTLNSPMLSAREPALGATANASIVDSLIAQQMINLSPQDRENSYMDVHCIPNFIEEIPILVESSLVLFEMEISSIPAAEKKAYTVATTMNPEYCHKTDLRLAFLRADMFDCKKAAARFIRHFQVKLDLFGQRNLAVDITQDDLNSSDMEALYSGHAQILATPDRGGRRICLWAVSDAIAERRLSEKAKLRREFYNGMTILRDQEAQKRGCALIRCCFSPCGGAKKHDFGWTFPKLGPSLPIRIVAVHLCYSDDDNCRNAWEQENATINMSLDPPSRVRVRTHYGSPKECLASLQRYGIEPESISLEGGGEKFRRELVAQRIQERLNCPRRTTIHVPSQYDVLFGKGSPVQNHSGNRKFRELVSRHEEEYEKAKKGEKIGLAQKVVDAVYASSGMFLKPEGNIWLSVDNNVAREKVSTAFRTQRIAEKRSGQR